MLALPPAGGVSEVNRRRRLLGRRSARRACSAANPPGGRERPPYNPSQTGSKTGNGIRLPGRRDDAGIVPYGGRGNWRRSVPADGLPRFVGRAFTPAANLAESGRCRVGRNCGGRFRCVGADACIGPRGLRRRKPSRRARSPPYNLSQTGSKTGNSIRRRDDGTMQASSPTEGRGERYCRFVPARCCRSV